MAENVNPIDVEKMLQHTDFPANKQKILSFAKHNHASDSIIGALEKIPDRQYSTAQDAAAETFSPGQPRGPMGSDSCDD